MKRIWLWVTAGLALSALVMADEIERVKEEVDAREAKQLEIECDFGAGGFFLRGDDIAEAALIDIVYDPEKVEYTVEYEVDDDIGYLNLESELRKHRNYRRVDNDWEIVLSKRYPSKIRIDIGASEMEIDLGGIPITELEMDIGAASGFIEFSEPNPERMEELSIDIGASSVEFAKLGNANFESLYMNCGAASADIDLRGTYTGETLVDLDVGVGSADVVLPEGLPVRIEGANDHWFSSVDIDDLDLERVRSGTYESEDYEDAKVRLLLILDVGMGSVDIYRR